MIVVRGCRVWPISRFSGSRESVRERCLSFRCNLVDNCRNSSMNLEEIVRELDTFAPLHLAKDWDNVGLLVEPSRPHVVHGVMLTNDLTHKVLTEAVERKVNLIISYHPPIFQSLKRLTQSSWKESIIVKCIENRIAIYSPHTCWDVTKGGNNDWLVSSFDGKVTPITCHAETKYKAHILQDGVLDDESLNKLLGKGLQREVSSNGKYNEFVCSKSQLTHLEDLCRSKSCSLRVLQLSNYPDCEKGEGRLVQLHSPMMIKDAMRTIKSHLKLHNLQLSLGYQMTDESLITSVAACAGSGASVLRGVTADLFLTGEMSHHEVLDIANSGEGKSAVVLCGHSNTERGFLTSHMLPHLRKVLKESVDVSVSSSDEDPLKTF